MIRDDRSIRVAPIGELFQLERTGRGYLSGDVAALHNMLNDCNRDQVRSLLITDAFLLICFMDDDSYEFSSIVALAMFEKHPVLDAIAYPSKRQLGAVNFAVRVEGFWKSWGIQSVRYGHANHVAFGIYELQWA